MRRKLSLVPLVAVVGWAVLVPTGPAAASVSGHWGILDPPIAGVALADVAATSANDVWAVGRSLSGGPVVEHWDGAGWTESSSPAVDGGELISVAAVASTDVWAVGADGPLFDTGTHALIEHWDGSSWHVVAGPDAGAPHSSLLSVTGITASDVWAVGQISTGDPYPDTLTEHWDGNSWSIVPSPSPGTYGAKLTGVAGAAANDVWAVGASSEDGGWAPLVLHWNGSAWVQSSFPDPGGGCAPPVAADVAAITTSDVWAVGSDGCPQPHAEHWDGVGWTAVSLATIGAPFSVSAVAALSSTDVWAVGGYTDFSSGLGRTLIEHWDGLSWTAVSSPNYDVTNQNNGLTSVVPITDTAAWATDSYGYNGQGGSAFERYTTDVFSSQLNASAPQDVSIGNPVALSGSLVFPDLNSVQGQTIRIERTNPDQTTTTLPSVETDAQGNFATQDVPTMLGLNTYTVYFDGDALRTGSQQSLGVGVRRVDSLTLAASDQRVGYKDRVDLTAHLSTHADSGLVSIFGHLFHQPSQLIASGTVDDSGMVSFTVHPAENTWYIARYAGDTIDGPANSKTVEVRVSVGINGKMIMGYATRGRYRLYHYTARCLHHPALCPIYEAQVSPNHSGECVYFTAQLYYAGWRRLFTTTCVKLDAKSRAGIVLLYGDRSIVGIHFRMQAVFKGDARNVSEKGPWSYFEVTK